MMRMLENVPRIRIFSYSERAWAGHQGVIVYGKPAMMFRVNKQGV